MAEEIDKSKEMCDQADNCLAMSYQIERIAYLENLVKKYKYDALTGLMQDLDFYDKFDRVFEEQQFAGTGFSLAILDIDNLHNVNRLESHEAGNILLVSAANVLRENFQDHQIYRTGGDEFCVVIRESMMLNEELIKILEMVPNVTYVVSKGENYSCPQHMFKMLDKDLSAKKTAQKKDQKRV